MLYFAHEMAVHILTFTYHVATVKLIAKFTYLLTEQLQMDGDDVISFKQWAHTDRTTIITREESMENFVDILCNQLDELTTHHYVSVAQASFLKTSKENLAADTILILLDFAENYAFVVQDSIQEFYWENRQATVHPAAVYYQSDGILQCLSMCVISNCLQHDTVSVYAFQDAILHHVNVNLPQIKRVLYFSDGAVAQYKNYKNFTNLMHYHEDFGFSAEWHFFATSHGKSVCDGVGGTVKRLAARSSLQSQHILTQKNYSNGHQPT